MLTDNDVMGPYLRMYLAIFLAGFVSLMLELALLREYVYTFGSTAAANALVISVFLGGLVLGSYWGTLRNFGSTESALRRVFALVQLFIIVYIGIFYLVKKYFIYQSGNELLILAFFILSVLIPSLISGLSFALSVKILHPKGERYTTYIYAISTLGSVIGSLAHGLYVVPAFGLNATYLISALLLAAVVILIGENLSPLFKGAVVLIAGIVASLVYFNLADTLFNQRDVVYSKHDQYGLVEVRKVDYRRAQEIDTFLRGDSNAVTIDPTAEYYDIVVNNEHQAFNIPADVELHRFWAESTLALYEKPVDVLVVGYASGVTGAAYLESPKTQTVDIVEIAQQTIEAAKRYFPLEHATIQGDPRARIIIDDFRGHVRFAPETYDIVVLDVFIRDPYQIGFYTLEFFDLLKKRLSSDGVIMIAGNGLSWSTTRLAFSHIYENREIPLERVRGELLYLKNNALDESFEEKGFRERDYGIFLDDYIYSDHQIRPVTEDDLTLYSSARPL
jgi:predicted membrane-bound spermidine synthase